MRKRKPVVHKAMLGESTTKCGQVAVYVFATESWKEVTCKRCLKFKPMNQATP
jgi:hypothetical protein